MIACYNSSNEYLGAFNNTSSLWAWSNENKSGTFTIPETGSQGQSLAATAKARFCLAYVDADNITITKR